jgi:hypothetical protein
MKWFVRVVVVLITAYTILFGAVLLAMVQPPERFGQIIKHAPMPLVWGVLPGPRMWMWARRGALSEGDEAPDFTLKAHDGKGRVTLSSYRGERPAVLVFGSYT